ncbi:MAG: hypothetical protein V1800_01700 [Candidatus Latescibacterota bacterium]
MLCLIIVLEKQECLEDVLSALVEVGVTKASIVESTSMNNTLADNVPIFAGLRHEMWRHPFTKMILALVEEEHILDELIAILKEEGIDFEEESTGMLVALPTARAIGYDR